MLLIAGAGDEFDNSRKRKVQVSPRATDKKAKLTVRIIVRDDNFLCMAEIKIGGMPYIFVTLYCWDL